MRAIEAITYPIPYTKNTAPKHPKTCAYHHELIGLSEAAMRFHD